MQDRFRFFQRVFGGEHEHYVKSIIQAAMESGNLDSIANMWDIFRSRWPDQPARDAAVAVALIMEKVPPASWPKLYQSFRHLPATKADLEHMTHLEGRVATHMFGLASLNTSGFIREEAVRKLAGTKDPQVPPYILLRLADWVPQVRAAAETAFRKFLSAEYVSVLLRHHPIIEHLQRVERADLSNELGLLAALLLAPEARVQVLDLLDHPDSGQRRFAYSLLERDPGNLPILLDKAVHDELPVIRAWAVDNAGKEPDDKAIRSLGILMDDSSARIRAAALRMAATNYWGQFGEEIRARIFDNAGGVRCAAIYHLRQHGSTDVAELFRSRLRGGHEADIGVLAGLSEVGTAGDYDLIQPYLEHRRARLRSAALAALGRLNRERAAGPALRALADSSGRVRREAISLLMRLAPGGHLDEMRKVVREGTIQAKTAGLGILALTGRWNVLADILEALAADDPEVVVAGWKALNHWSAEVWHPATAEDIQKAQQALEAVKRKSPNKPDWARASLEGVESKLMHLVKTWSRP
jgi:HEAT repeat protein